MAVSIPLSRQHNSLALYLDNSTPSTSHATSHSSILIMFSRSSCFLRQIASIHTRLLWTCFVVAGKRCHSRFTCFTTAISSCTLHSTPGYFYLQTIFSSPFIVSLKRLAISELSSRTDASSHHLKRGKGATRAGILPSLSSGLLDLVSKSRPLSLLLFSSRFLSQPLFKRGQKIVSSAQSFPSRPFTSPRTLADNSY